MKWDNLRLVPSTTRVVRTIAALMMLNPVLTGCATTMMVDEVFLGDPVELDFRVVHSDLPDAMVLWRESPGHNETALTFNPPYIGCEEVSFYVNAIKKKSKPLTHKSKEFSLVTLDNESAELAIWENIPSNDKCAVLLTRL